MNLTEHRKGGKFGGWKKYIHGRLFHLGQDRVRATAVAARLVEAGERLKASGGDWSDAVIDACYAVEPAAPSSAPAAAPVVVTVTAPAPVAIVSTVSLHTAVDQFLQAEEVRVQSRLISRAHYATRWDYCRAIRAGIADCPFSPSLSDLKGWVAHFAARPVSKKTGKPISAFYAVGVIKAIRSFVDWADAEGLCRLPRRWQDAFKGFSVKRLQTPVEKKKDAKGFRTLSLDEARLLWQTTTNTGKTYIGLGIWCGFTQQEIASCLIDDFEEVNGELFIDRCRHKTGVHGRWWLPPEVAACVRQWLNRTKKLPPEKNPQRLAFLTMDGNPLIHFGRYGDLERSDAVRCLWDRLRVHSKDYGYDIPSFKHLRKTFSQVVRDRLGAEYAEAFCCHSPDDVQTEHYSRPDPERLIDCLRFEVYPEWRLMFKSQDLGALRMARVGGQKAA